MGISGRTCLQVVSCAFIYSLIQDKQTLDIQFHRLSLCAFRSRLLVLFMQDHSFMLFYVCKLMRIVGVDTLITQFIFWENIQALQHIVCNPQKQLICVQPVNVCQVHHIYRYFLMNNSLSPRIPYFGSSYNFPVLTLGHYYWKAYIMCKQLSQGEDKRHLSCGI